MDEQANSRIVREVSVGVPLGDPPGPAATSFTLSLSAEAGAALGAITAGYAKDRPGGLDGGQAIDLLLRAVGQAAAA